MVKYSLEEPSADGFQYGLAAVVNKEQFNLGHQPCRQLEKQPVWQIRDFIASVPATGIPSTMLCCEMSLRKHMSCQLQRKLSNPECFTRNIFAIKVCSASHSERRAKGPDHSSADWGSVPCAF
eukprot:6488678-Amphidinium_carterae.1